MSMFCQVKQMNQCTYKPIYRPVLVVATNTKAQGKLGQTQSMQKVMRKNDMTWAKVDALPKGMIVGMCIMQEWEWITNSNVINQENHIWGPLVSKIIDATKAIKPIKYSKTGQRIYTPTITDCELIFNDTQIVKFYHQWSLAIPHEQFIGIDKQGLIGMNLMQPFAEWVITKTKRYENRYSCPFKIAIKSQPKPKLVHCVGCHKKDVKYICKCHLITQKKVKNK